MSAATHTPGPWAAKMSKWHEESLLVQAGMPSNRVLARFGSSDEPLDDTDRANAHLIAAAPDLLRVAELLVDWLDEEPGAHKLCDVARTAISKATAS